MFMYELPTVLTEGTCVSKSNMLRRRVCACVCVCRCIWVFCVNVGHLRCTFFQLPQGVWMTFWIMNVAHVDSCEEWREYEREPWRETVRERERWWSGYETYWILNDFKQWPLCALISYSFWDIKLSRYVASERARWVDVAIHWINHL